MNDVGAFLKTLTKHLNSETDRDSQVSVGPNEELDSANER